MKDGILPGYFAYEAGQSGLVEVTERRGKKGEITFFPNLVNVEVYKRLYEEYITLYGYFGKGTNDVMKRLNQIRKSY